MMKELIFEVLNDMAEELTSSKPDLSFSGSQKYI